MKNETSSPKSMTCKIWSCESVKSKGNKWDFQPKNQRGLVSEIAPKIKSVGVGSKIFKLGPYQGTIEELKEFARIKGMDSLSMGAIKIKVA
jgi:hypothetical protein